MNELAGILLHMDARKTYTLLLAPCIDIYPAMLSNGQIILGRLPVFRQIRIVVILAVKLAVFVDFAVRSQTGFDAKLDNALVDRRQYAWHAKAYRTDMRVLFCAKGRGTAAKDFRFSFQFTVYFKTDYGFVFHQLLPPSFAISSW